MGIRRKSIVLWLAVAASACSSQDPAPRPLLEVYGTDIGADWANVAVKRDGVMVETAMVIVNDAVLPLSSITGEYSGPLLAALAPGDPVSLEVRDGDLRVTGAGTFPDRPFVVAAYTSAAVASEGAIVVTWTSPSDPDSFAVAALWSCGLNCGAGKLFAAAGGARTLTIPAGALPHGLPVEAAVFAYDRGALAGDYAPNAERPGMNIRAESARLAVATGLTGPPPAKLQVHGSDIQASGASVRVMQHEQAIDEAVVVVNGQVLPGVGGGRYEASFASPLAAGDAVALTVTARGLTVTGSAHVPDGPVLTSPADGESFSQAQEIVVAWTSPKDPDEFMVSANWSCGPYCVTGTGFFAAGSARTLTIPPASLPGGDVQLTVFAYDDGALAGDYDAYPLHPGMNVRAWSATVTVGVQ